MTRNSSRSSTAVTASARIVANTPRRMRCLSRGRAEASAASAESRRSRSRSAAGGSNVGSPSARRQPTDATPASYAARAALACSVPNAATVARRIRTAARASSGRSVRRAAAGSTPGTSRRDVLTRRSSTKSNRRGAVSSACTRVNRSNRYASSSCGRWRSVGSASSSTGKRISAEARSISPSNRLQSSARAAPSCCSTNASCLRRVASSLDSARATTSSRLPSRERVA